jgi:hypothetical protein
MSFPSHAIALFAADYRQLPCAWPPNRTDHAGSAGIGSEEAQPSPTDRRVHSKRRRVGWEKLLPETRRAGALKARSNVCIMDASHRAGDIVWSVEFNGTQGARAMFVECVRLQPAWVAWSGTPAMDALRERLLAWPNEAVSAAMAFS